MAPEKKKKSKSITNDDESARAAAKDTADRTKSDHPLLRKSSSASLLDDGKQDQAGGAFPRLRRKSSSLRDVNAEEKEKKAATDNKSGSQKNNNAKRAKEKSARSGGRNESLPQVSTPAPKENTWVANGKNQTGAPRRRRPGDIELTRAATIENVVKYQLGQTELKKFKQCFSQIDLDQSGFIDYDEFFEFIDETKTPFSEGLFRMIDADSNGTIDYEEFVHATVLYCMYTRDEILQFAFDTFDPQRTGSIGEKEFKRLISLVNDGKPAYPGNFKNALNEFDKNKDGVLDFDEFKMLNKRYPMLLFPCFRLQDRMQKSTLGEAHWLMLHKRLYQRLKLENYQRKHGGALPPLTLIGSIKKFFHLDTIEVYQP